MMRRAGLSSFCTLLVKTLSLLSQICLKKAFFPLGSADYPLELTDTCFHGLRFSLALKHKYRRVYNWTGVVSTCMRVYIEAISYSNK